MSATSTCHVSLLRAPVVCRQERDSYRAVINSYENEVTIDMTSVTSRRLQELEAINAAYRKQCDELEAELQRATETQQQQQQQQGDSARRTKIKVSSGSTCTCTGYTCTGACNRHRHLDLVLPLQTLVCFLF